MSPLKKGKSKKVISDLAYTAGIIDGEGCLDIIQNRTSYIPRITVVNTCEEIITWLKEKHGGDIYKVQHQLNWKPSYIWRLQNKHVIDLLESIIDFLIIKFKQAVGLITLQAAKEAFGIRKGIKTTKEDRDAFDYLKKEVSKLNKKGVSVCQLRLIK